MSRMMSGSVESLSAASPTVALLDARMCESVTISPSGQKSPNKTDSDFQIRVAGGLSIV